jgi:hypothetical protein
MLHVRVLAPFRRRLSFAVFSAAALLLAAAPACADDPPGPANTPKIPGGLTLQATGTETGSWESNPLLTIHGAQPLWGSVTTPELVIDDKTPTDLLTMDALVNENIFNQQSFDSTDFHNKFNFTTQTERWQANFQEATDYDTTRTSDLFPAGLNGVILNEPVRHFGVTMSPELSYSPETTNKFTMAGSAAVDTYDNPIFADYDLYTLNPSWTHTFDPLNAGVLTFQVQRYQTTTGPQTTDDNVGPSIGWIGTLTPRLTAKATVGIQEWRQFGSGAGVVQEPWSLQYTFAGDLNFKGQQDTADLITSRTDYPFGNGTEALLTTYSVSDSHNLNELLALNVGVSYQTGSYQSSAAGDLNYLATGTGGLTFHATDRLDVVGTYQYRYETLNGISGNAQDNLFTIGVVYRPQPWTL